MDRLIVVSIFFAVLHVGISLFRTVLLLSQILNSTSDSRQDGQSSPFSTSSPTKGHGMRSCRASAVAGREKPSLVEHQRLYPLLLFVLQSREKSRWVVLIVSSDSKSSPRGDECTLPSAAVGPPQLTRWWQGHTRYLPLGGGRCKGAVSQLCHEQ